jgi:2,3-bisphosphoglycerate-independent phosphoglycerate mutase
MTNQLENAFNFSVLDVPPLPRHTPQSAAAVLVKLSVDHDFVFYKYQLADLVSHSGRVELARETFAAIEQFIAAVLDETDPNDTTVVITSDHGHLEQVGFSHGHPKSKVPTWWFGPEAVDVAPLLATPQGIFAAITSIRQSTSATMPN